MKGEEKERKKGSDHTPYLTGRSTALGLALMFRREEERKRRRDVLQNTSLHSIPIKCNFYTTFGVTLEPKSRPREGEQKKRRGKKGSDHLPQDRIPNI